MNEFKHCYDFFNVIHWNKVNELYLEAIKLGGDY
jgi:hypothetical protein